MFRILSFDVSSVSTGWAFFENKLKEFGTITPPPSLSTQEKLYYFDSNVNALLKINKPTHIIVEDTYLKNVRTLKTLMQFVGILNYECLYQCDIEPIFLSPQTVRSKYELKTKKDVFNFVKNKYKAKFRNYTFETGNDISDAVLMALYWHDELMKIDNGDKEINDG